jgi:pyridinium-3,5-biscarboxylic acid mononucleotide sulfurtransferase
LRTKAMITVQPLVREKPLLHGDKVNEVRGSLHAIGSVVVAFSGGVDSSLMAYLAAAELGDRAVAITAVSPSVAASEIADAQSFTRQFAIRHVLLDAREMEDPRYIENSPLRCYWCKNETYRLLSDYAKEHGFAGVVDGTNFDDTRDIRPGRKAATEFGVRSIFVEAEMTKAEIREAAKTFGLPIWNKAAKACLASRIPHGTPITAAILGRVEKAEDFLSGLGIHQKRVRHNHDIARIEVDPEEFTILLIHKDEILEEFHNLGYRFVALDLEGFRSGNYDRNLDRE